jgi:BNR/Asp-box repeat
LPPSAAAVGRVTGPQQERGVFKTSDGGATWQRVLFVDPNTGCSGLAMDANDPNTLFAGMWQVELHTWGEFSGGPGSGVHVSHDGGATWKKVTAGMPKSPVGKIDVAIAPSNSKRVYALIQTADQGSLWRSDDGGATFSTVSWARPLIGRAGYYIRIAVNPQNPDDVHILNSGYHHSTDGGKTFPSAGGGGGGGCGDCHDIWIDPKDGKRFVLTDDGGARINSPAGSVSVRLPIGQMYHVSTDRCAPAARMARPLPAFPESRDLVDR